jgi:hypothetical protein
VTTKEEGPLRPLLSISCPILLYPYSPRWSQGASERFYTKEEGAYTAPLKFSGDLPSFRDLSLPPLSFLDFYSLPQRACVVHPPYLALADILF